MSDIQTTFQSRLSSKLNNISRKLHDNSIRLGGVAVDCIRITPKVSAQGDIISRKVEDLDVISAIFPPLQDIPLKKVKNDSGQTIIIPYTFDIQPIEVLIPSNFLIDANDLIIKFYENLERQDPYIAIMEVKDMLGTFGARSIIYNKYKLTFFDGVLPDQILQWCIDMAKRRQELKW
jgi:hypothetical protein